MPSNAALSGASGQTDEWTRMLPLLVPLVNQLECGVMLVDEGDRVVLVSDPLSALFGMSVEDIGAMRPASFMDYVATLVDDPPEVLRERRLFPLEQGVVCEEFELQRPCRSVVRWVARRLEQPFSCLLAVVTDITAEVDLTSAYERLAVTDRLTGLANRRGAEQVIRREVVRAKRYGVPLSVLLFDIDHFKSLNDTHGHSVGDQVLRQVAKGIAGNLRDTDLASRWGGEEFLVILPTTPLEAARACAERIRGAVASLTLPTGQAVTISGGVAQYQPFESLQEVLARVDELLYAAKAGGRNRIC
jgi:diguanylate cyclase (GGDEF)-like protein